MPRILDIGAVAEQRAARGLLVSLRTGEMRRLNSLLTHPRYPLLEACMHLRLSARLLSIELLRRQLLVDIESVARELIDTLLALLVV